jgi:hypothetical protein
VISAIADLMLGGRGSIEVSCSFLPKGIAMGSTLKSFLFYEVRVSPSTQKFEKLKHEQGMQSQKRP